MKKIISTVLAMAMVMSLCVAMPAMAAMTQKPYPAADNTFRVDFEGTEAENGYSFSESAGGVLESVALNGSEETSQALKLTHTAENNASKSGSSWYPRQSGDRATALVSGDEIEIDFNIRIDKDSDTTVAPRILKLVMGDYTWKSDGSHGRYKTFDTSDYIMQLRYESGSWKMAFMNSGRNDFAALCSIPVDTWQAVKIVLHLDESGSTYDVYSNGYSLKGLKLYGDTAVNGAYPQLTLDNLLDIRFENTGNSYSYDYIWNKDLQTARIFGNTTLWIDDIVAKPHNGEVAINFDDEAYGLGTASGAASIVTTAGKDGNDTKALSIKYDGRKKYSDPGETSTWNVEDKTNMLVNGTEATFGFDFKIDGAYTYAGDYATRNNPGYPTFFVVTTDKGETTPLVSAYFTRARGEYPAYVNGPYTWEIQFANERLRYVKSGVEIGVDQWVSIDLVFHFAEGTYDAYINGVPSVKGLKIPMITGSDYLSGASAISKFTINAGTVSHYNVDTASTWGVYLDNITYDTFSWQDITAADGTFLDGESAVAAPGKGKTYSVKINNPNHLTEKTFIAMRALDEDGFLQDIVFKEVTLPIGERTLTWTFENLQADKDYDVKAFFINPETLAPYSSAFETVHLPLAQ